MVINVKVRDPGIYFGLDEDLYHADASCGSTDMRNLWLGAPDYWWSSKFNPNRDEDGDDNTPARIRGSAMHRLVLEGETAFDREYARGPDHDSSMTPAEKGALTKAANKKTAETGRTCLPAKAYDRVIVASAMITRNPHLKTALTGGMSEVSIFWREKSPVQGEVPCKARIDFLKPRGLGDLKSITNIRKIEFKRACRDAIANHRYDMQAAHYMRGRSHVVEFIADGCVHGDHDPNFLRKVAVERTFGFQFIFFQAAGAPSTFSTILSPANPVIELASLDLDRALLSYVEYMKEFGSNQVWLDLSRPEELAIEELPAYFGRK